MNVNDSERLAAILKSMGFEEAMDESNAQFLIYNTCSVREHAEARIYGKMEELMKRREAGEDILIAITGCMAGRDKKGVLRKRVGAAELFFPTSQMVELPRWIAELRPEWQTVGGCTDDYLKVRPLNKNSVQTYLTIQTGCNHFCTYCVVPYARGLERNRPLKDILDEAKELIAEGAKEITLLGQTVNSYKAPDPENFSVHNPYKNQFAALLWEINNLEGLIRYHWTAPHPAQMTEQVIHALTLNKQVNYIHLPVQAGSNEMLRKMNRKYTREDYIRIIEKIRSVKPDIAIGTDIIVGFSGESDKDFEETLDLYRVCDFDISYTAQYSVRSGTLGERLFPDDVSPFEKKRRWQAIQDLMETTVLKKNAHYQGQTIEVFAEKIADGFLYGTNNEMKQVKAAVIRDYAAGDLVRVSIKDPQMWQLIGEPVDG